LEDAGEPNGETGVVQKWREKRRSKSQNFDPNNPSKNIQNTATSLTTELTGKPNHTKKSSFTYKQPKKTKKKKKKKNTISTGSKTEKNKTSTALKLGEKNHPPLETS